MNESILSIDECLIYLDDNRSLPDTNTITYIGEILKEYMSNNVKFYDVIIKTDDEGNYIPNSRKVTITEDHLLSIRNIKDINPKQMYHYASQTFSENIQYPITANSFVIKNKSTTALESTSRTALGSGIYGTYNKPKTLIIDQSSYIIKFNNPYILQDREHGESITKASLATNRYLDKLLLILNDKQATFDDCAILIFNNDYSNILTLWNIVLARSNKSIDNNFLFNFLSSYLYDYLNDNTLFDNIYGESIYPLPIGILFSLLGYDGLLADDFNNNSLYRGCVNYDYTQAIVLQGETSSY